MTGIVQYLRVRPLLGRDFNVTETQIGAPQAIVISHRLWRSHFGADPEVLGRTIRLDDSYTVIGVLPSDFWFSPSPDALLPLRPTGSLSDLGSNTDVVGRQTFNNQRHGSIV